MVSPHANTTFFMSPKLDVIFIFAQFVYLLADPKVSSLTHRLFRSVLFTFQMFAIILIYMLLLSSLNPNMVRKHRLFDFNPL